LTPLLLLLPFVDAPAPRVCSRIFAMASSRASSHVVAWPERKTSVM
jgi:hypothetical protein